MRTLLIGACLCPLLSFAQPLTIGSTLPPLRLSPVVNTAEGSLDFSALRGKFVLLEFWATWCTACVKKLPLLDSLRQAFPADLQVVLVGRRSSIDNRQRIDAFFGTKCSPAGTAYTFPALVGDTVLNGLFPHEAIPYAVLLDRSGRVQALLGYDDLTAAALKPYLAQPLNTDTPPGSTPNLKRQTPNP